jgi:Fe-S cluster assembly protein SufD
MMALSTGNSPSSLRMQKYRELFDTFETDLNGERGSDVHSLRRSALERFVGLDFPTTRDEEWRFTNVAPIAAAEFVLPRFVSLSDADRSSIKSMYIDDAFRIVLVDGRVDESLSCKEGLPAGVVFCSMRTALSSHASVVHGALIRAREPLNNAFTFLNTAFLLDGVFLLVPKGVVVKRPFQMLFIATNSRDALLLQPRNLIVLEDQSQAAIAESYASLGDAVYLRNAVTDVILREGAVCEHDRLQEESKNSFHVGTLRVEQDAKSIFISNAVNLGGLISRNEVTSVLHAEGIECTLNGLSLGTGSQVMDSHTTIDHAAPHCNSHEVYKAILGGKSRGIFNGKIFVRKDAQKTDAKQTNKTLLLSDDATIDTKPQLEIFADDVKCTHGATVGQLDENQVFYLRSRGIDEEAARDMLTFAFACDVSKRIHIDSVRERVERVIRQRLDQDRKGS